MYIRKLIISSSFVLVKPKLTQIKFFLSPKKTANFIEMPILILHQINLKSIDITVE